MHDIEAALKVIQEMPYGSAQAEAARALWERVPAGAAPELRYRVLMENLSAAMHGGSNEYSMAVFPQLAAFRKAHPGVVDDHQYVWRLKWLANHLANYPEIPDERIRQAEDKYAEGLREVGGHPRNATYVRWKNCMWQGRLDRAASLLAEYQSNPLQDAHTDGPAYETLGMIQMALCANDLPKALETARPFLDGSLRSSPVMDAVYGCLLLPALRAGRAEEAAAWHRKGYALIRSNAKYLNHAGEHLLYLAAIGDAGRFLRLLRTHLPWLEHNRCPSDYVWFYAGAAAGCEMAAETGERTTPLSLPLPGRLAALWGTDPMPVADLARKFEAQALEVAASFDKRNGNTWHADFVRRSLAQARDYRGQRTAQ